MLVKGWSPPAAGRGLPWRRLSGEGTQPTHDPWWTTPAYGTLGFFSSVTVPVVNEKLLAFASLAFKVVTAECAVATELQNRTVIEADPLAGTSMLRGVTVGVPPSKLVDVSVILALTPALSV